MRWEKRGSVCDKMLCAIEMMSGGWLLLEDEYWSVFGAAVCIIPVGV